MSDLKPSQTLLTLRNWSRQMQDEDGPTPAERILWRQIADEIDAYLDDDPAPSPDQDGLWTTTEDA